ncbi:hypothetical protein E2562_036513 [Oryza meyeriana var. granulata]|uniref:Uncharacterized protein n=1 Tax=Oryza meyeriana var. granulata TaxID=110450 RepID=A0A6G1FGF8_9ORYZ|nr:hypothetical protein E2562_036513 [Oryza meyeriana var. granulata]
MKGSAQPRTGAAAAADDDVELLKAVAQAWHAQSGNPRAAQGTDDGGGISGARRAGWGSPRHRPSRAWDFAQSLWDTYELVAVARKLESGLILADHPPGAQERAATTREGGGGVKRARESSRSLRSMFLRSSSRRFEESSS